MTDNSSSSDYQSTMPDEIDIIGVLANIYGAIKKSLKLILIITVIGTVLGIVYHINKKPTYRSYMVASSKLLDVEHIKLLVENLQTHLNNGDWKELGSLLYLDSTLAKGIKDITLVESKIDKKKNDKNIFYLEIRLISNQSLTAYQQGIVHYFENNEYIKKRIDLDKMRYEKLLGDIAREEIKLDSIRAQINNRFLYISENKNVKANNVFIQDMAELNAQKLTLLEKKYNTEKLLALANNLHVIQNFQLYNKPANVGFWGSLSLSICTSLLVSLLLILFLEVYRLIKKRSDLAT